MRPRAAGGMTVAGKYWLLKPEKPRPWRFDLPRLTLAAWQIPWKHAVTLGATFRRFLTADFYIRDTNTVLFHTHDVGKSEYSRIIDGSRRPRNRPAHEERLRALGRMSGERLLEEFHVEGLYVHKFAFPAEHYLQRKPSIPAAFLHGILDSGVQLQLNMGGVSRQLTKTSKPGYYQELVVPLRKRQNLVWSSHARDWRTVAELLEMVPYEERLFYLYEADRITFQYAEQLDARIRYKWQQPLTMEQRLMRATFDDPPLEKVKKILDSPTRPEWLTTDTVLMKSERVRGPPRSREADVPAEDRVETAWSRDFNRYYDVDEDEVDEEDEGADELLLKHQATAIKE